MIVRKLSVEGSLKLVWEDIIIFNLYITRKICIAIMIDLGGVNMKFFVTGVGGQLGHDVMNELLKRGHEGVCSDIQENYSGVNDGSAVCEAPYVTLDITDKK